MKIKRITLTTSFLAIFAGCIGLAIVHYDRQARHKGISLSKAENTAIKSSLYPNKRDNDIPLIVELPDARIMRATKNELKDCSKELSLEEEVDASADETNFGERIKLDAWNRSLQAEPMLIVLHETVMSETATVSFFQTPHVNDADQASYHMLIAIDGARLRVVPDEKRAYGAGMSAFGDATQRTKSSSVGSINNIALHVSLVTPADGRNNSSGHSGYTSNQYKSLAQQTLLWQAKFGIPLTRVTTHEAVDRSHTRYDPRSFNWDIFDRYYAEAVRLCGLERFDNGQAGL